MDKQEQEKTQAFAFWIRTGRWPVAIDRGGIELKFNPYHDPRNGQFTFEPNASVSADRPRSLRAAKSNVDVIVKQAAATIDDTGAHGSPNPTLAAQSRPPGRLPSIMSRGGNSRAFDDPMTLEQAFSGLAGASANAVVAVADNLFDLRGPADMAASEILDNLSRKTINDIVSVDSKWHYDALEPLTTVSGRINRLNDLRLQRAAAYLRVRGDTEPLKVEIIRFLQLRVDVAYDLGLKQLKAGLLRRRLSDNEALGNFVDRRVRSNLRELFARLGIDSSGPGPVRVNRRENDSSGTDLTYRRPDARIGDLAIDVTLTFKTIKTAQVRGFFNTDSRPSAVAIIRLSQLGENQAYAIPRPKDVR